MQGRFPGTIRVWAVQGLFSLSRRAELARPDRPLHDLAPNGTVSQDGTEFAGVGTQGDMTASRLVHRSPITALSLGSIPPYDAEAACAAFDCEAWPRISCSARNQSSSGDPIGQPRSSQRRYARRAISSCSEFWVCGVAGSSLMIVTSLKRFTGFFGGCTFNDGLQFAEIPGPGVVSQ